METKLDQIREFVHSKVRQVASARRQPLPDLDDNFNLVEAGLFDSLGFVNLISAIENEFNFEIDPGDLAPEEFTILGNLIGAAARSASAPTDQGHSHEEAASARRED